MESESPPVSNFENTCKNFGKIYFVLIFSLYSVLCISKKNITAECFAAVFSGTKFNKISVHIQCEKHGKLRRAQRIP